MLSGLNLKQLETFYWVTRLGSFSAAAVRLNTTQPGVSSRLRELEACLGASVLERSRHGARLTPKGREVLRLVEHLLVLDREWQARLGPSTNLVGLVRLGAADSIAMTLVPILLKTLRELHPNVDVELLVDLSVHLQHRLREREIDIAFIAGDMGAPEYRTKSLGGMEQAWMCSPALGLPRGRQNAASLSAQPVFTHSRGSHQHHMVLNWFEEAGARPKQLHTCSSLATMIKLTIDGLGISVLPVPLVRRELSARQLRRLDVDEPLPPNQFVVTWSAALAQAAVPVVATLAVRIAKNSRVFANVRD